MTNPFQRFLKTLKHQWMAKKIHESFEKLIKHHEQCHGWDRQGGSLEIKRRGRHSESLGWGWAHQKREWASQEKGGYWVDIDRLEWVEQSPDQWRARLHLKWLAITDPQNDTKGIWFQTHLDWRLKPHQVMDWLFDLGESCESSILKSRHQVNGLWEPIIQAWSDELRHPNRLQEPSKEPLTLPYWETDQIIDQKQGQEGGGSATLRPLWSFFTRWDRWKDLTDEERRSFPAIEQWSAAWENVKKMFINGSFHELKEASPIEQWMAERYAWHWMHLHIQLGSEGQFESRCFWKELPLELQRKWAPGVLSELARADAGDWVSLAAWKRAYEWVNEIQQSGVTFSDSDWDCPLAWVLCDDWSEERLSQHRSTLEGKEWHKGLEIALVGFCAGGHPDKQKKAFEWFWEACAKHLSSDDQWYRLVRSLGTGDLQLKEGLTYFPVLESIFRVSEGLSKKLEERQVQSGQSIQEFMHDRLTWAWLSGPSPSLISPNAPKIQGKLSDYLMSALWINWTAEELSAIPLEERDFPVVRFEQWLNQWKWSSERWLTASWAQKSKSDIIEGVWDAIHGDHPAPVIVRWVEWLESHGIPLELEEGQDERALFNPTIRDLYRRNQAEKVRVFLSEHLTEVGPAAQDEPESQCPPPAVKKKRL